MRARIEIQPVQSPIAKTMGDITTRMAARNPAQDAYYQAHAEELQAKNALQQQQQEAVEAAPSKIAEIIGKFTRGGKPVVPWENPDTGDVIENTNTDVPLETPQAASQRRQIQTAALMAALPKDSQGGLKEGLAIGNMYSSDPDEFRRGVAISGQAGSLTPNFASTSAEGDRIDTRNTNNKIREEAAKPSSFKPYVYTKPDGTPGTTVDGKTDFHTGAPVPGGPVVPASVQATNMGGLTTATQTDMQKKQIAGAELTALLDTYDEAIQKAPDDAFGITGHGQMLIGDLATQAKNVAPVLGKLGFMTDPGKGDPITQAMQQAQAEAVAKGMNPQEAAQLFAGVNPQHQLQALNALLRYKAGSALAGQQGHDFSIKDMQVLDPVTPDPLGATSSKEKLVNSNKLLRQILVGQQGARDNIQKPGGAPTASRSPDQSGAILMKARQAIAAGKDRSAVMQRLQQMGITPPGDL